MDELAEQIEDELGDFVFSDNGESLEQIVGYLSGDARRDDRRGRILHRRPDRRAPDFVSGSSRYFVGGAVVYSNELKTALADVPAR